MKGKSHSPQQIATKLRVVERLQAREGLWVAAAAKRVEVAEWTIDRWRKQVGGMNRDDAKRLKELEKENGCPRRSRGSGTARSPSSSARQACG